MLASFGWILFLLIGIGVLGLAAYVEIGRRKRAAAERRAVWKAHDDWLQSSHITSPDDKGPHLGRGTGQ